MPGSAVTLLLLLLCSCIPIVSSEAIHEADDSPSVESWKNERCAGVKFDAACDGCFGEDKNDFAFELIVSSTNGVCGESDIALNGQQLNFTWDGASGIGSGNVSANLADGSRTFNLSTSYRSLCVASPEGSVQKYAAQILTVAFHPEGQSVDEGNSGFAVSFNSLAEPSIFRLVTTPIAVSDDDLSLDYWLDPNGLRNTRPSEKILDNSQDDDKLEEELQKLNSLKAQAEALQAKIDSKEHDIRMHLLRECSCISARLKECSDFKCFVVTSFKVVPDIFRLMRYRFGSLPSSVSERPCRHLGASSQRNSSETHNPTSTPGSATGPPSFNASDIDTDLPDTPDIINPHHPIQPEPPHPSQLTPHSIKEFIRNMAIIFLIASISWLLLQQCRNSVAWRRRRVDIAARREERRTRLQYRAAARRYKWRQWWKNRMRIFSRWNNNASQHSLPTYENQDSGQHDPDAQEQLSDRPQTGDRNVQSEILGFRRVFELVGELIRPDNGHSPVYHEVGSEGDIGEFPAHRATAGTPAPSSTAPLTTVGSPRASSVLTYSTESSVTLDSLDPETATMVST